VPADGQTAEANAPGFGTYIFYPTATDGFLGDVSKDARCSYDNSGTEVLIACANNPCSSGMRQADLPLGTWIISCTITSQRAHLLTDKALVTKKFDVTVSNSRSLGTPHDKPEQSSAHGSRITLERWLCLQLHALALLARGCTLHGDLFPY
jgi:hypothetical protein